MGTRSLTIVNDEHNEKEMMVFYRHYDGYPTGHGTDLLNFLNNMNIVRIKPEDGMLVVFPSYLNHYQALYKGVEDRIVVAFNSTINKLGEED